MTVVMANAVVSVIAKNGTNNGCCESSPISDELAAFFESVFLSVVLLRKL